MIQMSSNWSKSKWLSLFAISSSLLLLFATPAVAQTTMQQQQGDDAAETEEADDETEKTSETQTTTDDSDADSVDDREAPGEDQDYVESDWSRFHIPGFRFALGTDFDGNSNISGGLGYMYALEWRWRILESETYFRGGGGPDLNFVGGTHNGFDGLTAYLSTRLHIRGPRGGMSLEGGIGSGFAGTAVFPSFRVGAFYAGESFEIGYMFQQTLIAQQPTWMTPHNIALRWHIPVFEH